MAIRRPIFLKLFGPLLAFAATFAAIVAIDRSSSPEPATGSGGSSGAEALSSLGNTYLQKLRETADAGYYRRAELAFERALEREPRNAGALTGLGALALARHDFRAALDYGRRALAEAPGVARVYGVIVDAQVELGRYAQAERSLQRMVDLEPNLSSYARVSYFRELHGDLDGAVAAMRLAVSAGGEAPENFAYVQTLLGDLELARGRIAIAERAYRTALSRYAGYAPAEAGMARVATARGDLGRAIARYRAVVERLPLAEHVIALGEAELAAGRTAAARETFALARVQQRLLARTGVVADAAQVLFEAEYGDRGRALALARRGWRSAPSVRSADALGWALTRAGRPAAGLAWARRALRLGSRDPLFLYHAGIAAKRSGHGPLAERYLERSLERNRRFSPLHAQRARRALAALR